MINCYLICKIINIFDKEYLCDFYPQEGITCWLLLHRHQILTRNSFSPKKLRLWSIWDPSTILTKLTQSLFPRSVCWLSWIFFSGPFSYGAGEVLWSVAIMKVNFETNFEKKSKHWFYNSNTSWYLSCPIGKWTGKNYSRQPAFSPRTLALS